MHKIVRFILIFSLFLSLRSFAITVKDEKGEFTLDKNPSRIVVLEFSFLDALAIGGVKPVGIADDKDKERILPKIRELIGDYTSVGTRAQPSLEAISSLKPDLIIADLSRHQSVYEDLKKIAPTIILNSRLGSYQDLINQTQIIGDLINKHDEIKKRIENYQKTIKEIESSLPKSQVVALGASREDGFNVYSENSFAGGLMKLLGQNLPDYAGKKPYADINLEQLVAINPDWIIVGHYRENSQIKKWEKEALWSVINAVKNNHVISVEPNLWFRSRGLLAAEQMAFEIKDFMSEK